MTIEIYGKDNCAYCTKAINLAEIQSMDFTYKKLDVDFNREEMMSMFPTARTFPQIKVDGNAIGGYEQFMEYVKQAA
jgi:glutaredoxin 3